MSNWPILPAGRDLVHWLRKGGYPDRAPRFVLWLYRWRAFWLEQHFALIRSTGPAIQSYPYPYGEGLIFILGFWRSGTTLLHELLAKAPGCGAPFTWQCMDPSTLLLTGRKIAHTVIQRPMDQVLVSSNSPQEDEFALMAMGVPSVYQGFLDPRRLPELEALLNPEQWVAADASWLDTLESFLSWCRKEGQDRMVVKSPNHLFRYRALATRYPRARFVWTLRSPMELWASNLRMWRSMIERYGLWSARGGELEAFLEKALVSYGDLLEQLSHEGVFHEHPVFAYEDLVTTPEAVLTPLVERLGLEPWKTWGTAIQHRIKAKPKGPMESKSSSASDALLARLETLHGTILRGH